MAAQIPDEAAKPRKFARIKAYSPGGTDDRSLANKKKFLIDPYDVETVKEFDGCLGTPADCALDLATLGRQFRDATEGVVGKSLNVPDWPTGALKQLLRRPLVSGPEITHALYKKLLG
jgi:hypothetical protein